MSFLRILPAALGGLLLLASPTAAQAPRESEARVSFHAGRAAWERGAYARALELWSQSYALTPHPMMQINIGNAWLRLGRDREAAAAYRRFLATAPTDAPQRGEVQGLLARLDAPEREQTSTAGFDPAGGPGTWVALGSSLLAGAIAAGLWVDMESRFGAMAGSCGVTPQGCDAGAIDSVSAERDASLALVGISLTALGVAAVLWVIEGLP